MRAPSFFRTLAPLGAAAGLLATACTHATPRSAPSGVAVADAAATRAAMEPRELPADQQVMQALNRLTFGPRPGDAARKPQRLPFCKNHLSAN